MLTIWKWHALGFDKNTYDMYMCCRLSNIFAIDLSTLYFLFSKKGVFTLFYIKLTHLAHSNIYTYLRDLQC